MTVPLCVRNEKPTAPERLDDPEVHVVRDVLVEDDPALGVEVGRELLLARSRRRLEEQREPALARDLLEHARPFLRLAPDEAYVELRRDALARTDQRCVVVDREPMPALPEEPPQARMVSEPTSKSLAIWA